MPAEIHVPIDVDDSAFRSFAGIFEKYRNSLEASKGDWSAIVVVMSGAAQSATEMQEALEGGGDALAAAASIGSKFQQSAERAAGAFSRVQSATKGAASNIKEATLALLKWASVTTLIGGGAGALSMDALGSHVSGLRTASMRAGTTAGGREAFAINFARFGDAEGVLGRVANIKNSADHTALRNLGITDAQIKEMDPADLAALAYQKLQERAKNQNPNYLNDWMTSNRVNEVFDLGQALQARSTSKEEMADVQGHFREDRPRLEMTPKAQLGWTKFTMTLDLASAVIKRVFAENLSHLTPGLGKLSDAFSHLLEILMAKGGPLEHGLEALADGLEWFGRHLRDDIRWEKLFGDLFDGVVALAKWTKKLIEGLASVAKWFGISSASAATSGGGNGAGGAAGGENYSGAPFKQGKGEDQEVIDFIRQDAAKHGIDPEIALRVARSEGLKGFHPSNGEWSAGSNDLGSSFGPLQAHFAANIPGMRARGQGDAMAKEGINARDLTQWRKVIDWQLRYAKKHGWSEWHGWRGDPRAGLNYQPPQIAPTYHTKVTISKPPGGDIAASANAAAHQTH